MHQLEETRQAWAIVGPEKQKVASMLTDIVIPVRDQLHLTQSIIEQLQNIDGWNRCWIFDNGSTDDTKQFLLTLPPQFISVDAEGNTIYEMWDRGFQYAKESDYLLFLNNDITLHPDTISTLNFILSSNDKFWIVYPDYDFPDIKGSDKYVIKKTKGTYRHGGMCGFCFMLKRAKVTWQPLVDPQFIWWGGDDDIAFEVEKRGGSQIRVVGLPIQHLNEGTARNFKLGEQKKKDLEAVKRKWGK